MASDMMLLRKKLESEYERLCLEFGPTPADGREYDLWQAKLAAAGRMYSMAQSATFDVEPTEAVKAKATCGCVFKTIEGVPLVVVADGNCPIHGIWFCEECGAGMPVGEDRGKVRLCSNCAGSEIMPPIGFTREGLQSLLEDIARAPDPIELESLREVARWAQATLTALNVGDVKSGSALHLKLREVMIAHRENHA